MVDIRLVQLSPLSVFIDDKFAAIVDICPVGYDKIAQLDTLFVACTDARHGREARSKLLQQRFEVQSSFKRAGIGGVRNMNRQRLSQRIVDACVIVINLMLFIKGSLELDAIESC